MFELKRISYPDAAPGWIDGVYHERKRVSTDVNKSDYIHGDTFVLPSKSWTETEVSGFGIYTYVETIALTYANKCYDGKWKFTFENRDDFDISVSCLANDILLINNALIPAKGSATSEFSLYSTEDVSTFCFFINNDCTKKEDAPDNTIVISDIEYTAMTLPDEKIMPTIFLASDSTVSNYQVNTAPQTGWGQVLPLFAKELNVVNKAIGARSSKSFILEGRWNEILSMARPGDYALIQWGHNDATAIRPNRYCTPPEYRMWLKKYITSCKARKIVPVLITPVSLRAWDEEQNRFPISFGEYRNECIALAKEEDILLIDLGGKSNELLNSLPKSESRYLYLQAPKGAYPDSVYKDGVNDRAHLSYYGALVFCKIIVEELMAHTPLLKYLTLDVPIEKPSFEFPAPPENVASPDNFTIQEIQISDSSATFLLSWDAVPDADGYLVMRKSSKEFQFSQLRRVSAAEHKTSTVLPFTLMANDTYDLYVVACIADGLSNPSSQIHVDLHNPLS